MKNLSQAECLHCDTSSQAFRFPLEQTENFHIVCDSHSIMEGHILIIPKQHISCVGAYSKRLFESFLQSHKRVSQFLMQEYGCVSSFEHGIFGQTVFHSHVHYLPFEGKSTAIVPEGEQRLSKLQDLASLSKLLEKDGGYLYFSIGKYMWTVDTDIAAPRFFRDRFARVLGRPEKGNWKKIDTDKALMRESETDALNTQRKWWNWKDNK